jgi:tetratricopeptide (TPR) repeat protein
MGDLEALERTGRDLASLRPEDFASGVAVRCGSRSVVQLIVCGHGPLGRALLERMNERADDELMRDPLAWVWLSAARAMSALFADDPMPFAKGGDRMVATSLENGDMRTACNLRHYVGIALNIVGAHEAAAAHLRAGMTMGESLGLLTFATSIRIELAMALNALGRRDEATELARAALQETRVQRDRFQEGRANDVLALTLLHDGALEPAEGHARAAVELSAAVAPPFRRASLATLALTLIARKKPVEALAIATEALALRGTASFGPLDFARLAYAEALWALERVDDAREAIRLARDNALKGAERVEIFRDVYVQSPVVARTLALAQAWLEAPSDRAP